MEETEQNYSDEVEEELKLLNETIGDLDELIEMIFAPYEGDYIVDDIDVLEIDHCIACLDYDDVMEVMSNEKEEVL